MKTTFLIILLSLLHLAGYCQQNEKIPAEKVYNLHTSKFLLRLNDSLVREYDRPLIEVETIAIKIIDVYFNKKTDELRIMGRACFGDTANNAGIPYVSIYKGTRKDSTLSNFALLGESTNGQNLKDHGFFDISVKLKEGESLYFVMPQFYLEEFKLGMLLTNGL